MTVGEAGTNTYTVVLDTEPTSNVTVTLSSDDTSAATVTSSLTFTTSNWSSAQTVTITGVNDGDSVNETVTISHSISGGGYGSITMTDITATMTDDDDITFGGLTYKNVTSPDTGRVWLDRNLGATQVCTSFDDSSCYGHLYQWGRNDDGHESRLSSTTTTLANSITPGNNTFILTSATPPVWTTTDASGSARVSAWTDGGANDVCPSGYGVPTEAEYIADTTNASTVPLTTSATAYSGFLKLPVSGYRSNVDGGLNNQNHTGYYFFREFSSVYTYPRYLTFTASTVATGVVYSVYGMSVRCILE
jgi:uncharacterized protein (TIGR02145 family)